MVLRSAAVMLCLALVDARALQADCGWVLWESSDLFDMKTRESTVSWDILEAFEQFGECQSARQRAWDRRKADLVDPRDPAKPNPKYPGIKEVRAVPTMIFQTFTNDSRLSLNYICLPGATDPRRARNSGENRP